MDRTHIDHDQQRWFGVFSHEDTCFPNCVAKAKLEIIVAADSVAKLYAVKAALQQMGVDEFLESSLLCHGHRMGRQASYRGVAYTANFVEKLKLEMLVPLDAVVPVVEAIGNIAKAEGMEDWRLCLTPQVFPIDLTASLGS
ncbi:P-II family nitrogen regulator [Desulfovibrio sp. TomC]|uniref:P-II family nitrogen regulator n=1 Tax=Desulfovibrio sp. TomC TaxID=1562888 RepID=UPI00069D3E28|nr:P-II family nitrogen regulator [Desulfovibrio sp. TomC]